jgi:predicted branched-subunit amino acid permease
VSTASTATATTASRHSARAGATAMLPWLVGVVPYGLVIGVTVGASRIGPAAGIASGATIYAGSAQLAVIEMLERGAAPLVVIAAALAINCRLIFYSGSMAPLWRGTSRWFRVAASYLLVDPSYAVGKDGYADRPVAAGHAYYLGGAAVLWIAWQAAIVTGFVAGAGVPRALQLEYVVPLFLVADVARAASTRGTVAAAVVGAGVGVVGTSLPLQSGPLVAIVSGIAVAHLIDGRSS